MREAGRRLPVLRDEDVVAVQIGRRPRSAVEVVRRCRLGMPMVTRVPPVIEDGVPFPTRYWLTCPLAVRRVARLEAAGGVRLMEREVDGDPRLAEALEQAHRRYARERDAAVPASASLAPHGGIGGTHERGVKCLHAHYADHLAGNDNPVGTRVAPDVEPLDCETPCVCGNGSGAATRNADWRPRARLSTAPEQS